MASGQTKIFVDPGGTPSGPGLSWGSAYSDLQAAIDAAQPGYLILVAEGTYHPPTAGLSDPREGAFTIDKELGLFGGYKGLSVTNPSTTPGQPDGSTYNTVLTGDPGTPASPSDDAYNVVRVDGTTMAADQSVLFDGFRVQRGNADGHNAAYQDGGGIWASDVNLRLENCTVQDCYAVRNGGGVHAVDANLACKLTRFRNNTAGTAGGGICLVGHKTVDVSKPWLTSRLHNVILDRNLCEGNGGGIAVQYGDTPVGSFEMANCVVRDNMANFGGGLSLIPDPAEDVVGSLLVSNCTIAYNAASGGTGAGMFLSGSSVTAVHLENSIVWENRAIGMGQEDNIYRIGNCIDPDYCVIGPTIQTPAYSNLLHILGVDPMFVNGPARDFSLSSVSPCLEAGDDTLIVLDRLDLDEDGDVNEQLPRDFKMTVGGTTPSPRQVRYPVASAFGVEDGLVSGIVDMGAYETPEP